MTENNESIWHTKDERPDNDTIIIYPVGDVVLGGNIYEWTDWDLIKTNIQYGWIYQQDMKKLAQSAESESLKSENERLKKALEIAHTEYKKSLILNL